MVFWSDVHEHTIRTAGLQGELERICLTTKDGLGVADGDINFIYM